MKRNMIRVVIGVLGIIIAAGSVWVWHTRRDIDENDRLVLYGTVDIRQVQLAFNNSERITTLLVQEGDRVHAGQLLATLDSRRFEASVADREAKEAAQREVVARLDAGNRPEEIRKAEADMQAAKADRDNAERTLKRAEALHTYDAVAQQNLDDARAAQEVAAARLASAMQTYNLMLLGPRKEDVAAAKATLKSYEAGLELAKQDLANAKLYAPSSGVIQARLLEPGDMASPQKPVFTLALDDPLWVRAYVAETDLGKIRLGMKAHITADSFPDKRYEGWIGLISPTAEFTPKTVETSEVRTKLVYQVRVFVRNPQGELRLGMPAVVTVPLNQPLE
jgi:HlyD family secretion protein